MARTDFRSVDEYVATQPKASQAILQRVRSAIRKALPGAEEAISYQIPAYKLRARSVLYFAGWKEHYSLYPASGRLDRRVQGATLLRTRSTRPRSASRSLSPSP